MDSAVVVIKKEMTKPFSKRETIFLSHTQKVIRSMFNISPGLIIETLPAVVFLTSQTLRRKKKRSNIVEQSYV